LYDKTHTIAIAPHLSAKAASGLANIFPANGFAMRERKPDQDDLALIEAWS
jgi:hypothetical protein